MRDEFVEARGVLRDLPSVAHGAFDFGELERLGLSPNAVLDFSVNGNPYGPADGVTAVVSQTPIDRYPDRDCLALRRALADLLGVPMDNVLAANGIAEMVWLAALAYVRPADEVLLLAPTFGEYAHAAALMGGRVTAVTATAAHNFGIDRACVEAKLAHTYYRLAFICRPNNPTGQLLPLAWLAEWATHYPATLFVVDEAYIAFVADGGGETAVSLLASHPNLLIMRSMTKEYALAGLRLGYAVAHTDVVAALGQVKPPWSVNALAQAAGVAALADQAHVTQSVAQLQRHKVALAAGLKGCGFAPVPSATHYFLLPVGDGAALRQRLLRRGLLVRDCASFGLPGFVRIATRRAEENGRLLTAISEIADQGLGR